MNLKLSPRTHSQIKAALHEDIGRGDLTTEILIPRSAKGRASVVACESGIFCGETVVRTLLKITDSSLRVKFFVGDGEAFPKNKKVLEIKGRLHPILKAERTLLNFISHLSGIATLTRQYVQKVRGTSAKILDTRKTTPLWRELEKYAVRSGGGENHRFGLWDEILVKDNHWQAIRDLLDQTHGRYFRRKLGPVLRRSQIPVEVEVKNLRELAHLLETGLVPNRILLDNFSIRELRQAVLFVKKVFQVLKTRYRIHAQPPLLEASGCIHLANVRAVAKTGVHRISIGRLTHSAPAIDFSLDVTL